LTKRQAGGLAFFDCLKSETFISQPMLIIRKEQLAVFSRQMVEVFVDRAALQLRAKYQEPLQDIPDEDLYSIIHDGIAKARTYGITYETDVLQFLEHTISLGADFDSNPEMNRILEILSQSIDGTMKMILLNEYIQSQAKESRTMETRWADRK